jgi:hypothetical protein
MLLPGNDKSFFQAIAILGTRCQLMGVEPQGTSDPPMIIQTSTTRAYYPIPRERTTLIRGTGRVRYVRGFIVLNPKGSQRRKGVS